MSNPPAAPRPTNEAPISTMPMMSLSLRFIAIPPGTNSKAVGGKIAMGLGEKITVWRGKVFPDFRFFLFAFNFVWNPTQGGGF